MTTMTKDQAETRYRLAARALVNATRAEVAATGEERRLLSLVVEDIAALCHERWRDVLAAEWDEPIPYRLADAPPLA